MAFQFDEQMMEKLRRGDAKAYEDVARCVYQYVDALVRHVRNSTNFVLNWHDCEDIVQDMNIKVFVNKQFVQYLDKSASDFSKIFYHSLHNLALDAIDKLIKSKKGSGNKVSLEKPVNNGEENRKTFGDTLPEEKSLSRTFRGKGLTKEEFKNLVDDLRTAMKLHAGDDNVRQWVLESFFFKQMKAEEISKVVGQIFPGKVFESGSVYSLVSRFRNGPELDAVVTKWMAGEAWVRMR